MSNIKNTGSESSVRSVINRINNFIAHHKQYIPGAQLLPGLFWILSLFGGSFGIIIVYSFVQQAPPSGAVNITVDNYIRFLSDNLYTSVFFESLIIGVQVTFITLLIAYPVAYYLAFTDHKRKNLMVLLVILPFWINLVIRTYAWRLILGRGGFINYLIVDLMSIRSQPVDLLFSQSSIVLGLVHVFLPFMMLPIFTSLNSIHTEQIEAAKNLGANKLQAFYEVTLPQSLPGVAAGVAIVFVLGFGSFVIPLLLGGPRNIMIANIISQMFGRLQEWGLGSAMAVVVTVVSLGFIYIFNQLIGLGDVYGGDV
jgi:ABC-type spermidine/putrescine transport system permease subunit I